MLISLLMVRLGYGSLQCAVVTRKLTLHSASSVEDIRTAASCNMNNRKKVYFLEEK